MTVNFTSTRAGFKLSVHFWASLQKNKQKNNIWVTSHTSTSIIDKKKKSPKLLSKPNLLASKLKLNVSGFEKKCTEEDCLTLTFSNQKVMWWIYSGFNQGSYLTLTCF